MPSLSALTRRSSLLWMWLSLPLLATRTFPVLADFGDFVDPTFNCPARTTCRQVCVAAVEDCPLTMLCDQGETLCDDGVCRTSCSGTEESPCEFQCASKACAKVIDTTEQCEDLYKEYYDQEEACGELELAETINLFSFTEPAFLVSYFWIAAAVGLLILWCAYNQRWSPVPGSTQSLELCFSTTVSKQSNSVQAFQTGYKRHLVGGILHVFTLLTVFGIQAMLAWLTAQYYVQQDVIPGINGIFDDEVQVLITFEMTWIIGFFWTFALKFPYSIASLHYRRCVLGEATHVAIAIASSLDETTEAKTFDASYMQGLRRIFNFFFHAVHYAMSFIFSDSNTFGCPRRRRNDFFKILPVLTDPSDGSRYIVFRFRRYNLDQDRFVPGVLDTLEHLADIRQADTSEGLTQTEIIQRRQVVGENSIAMPRPYFFQVWLREVSKPFYTYQTFMVWIFFPLYYYYMAITWSVLILSASLAVSFFQYRNEESLYQITKIEGDVQVLRNSQRQTIPHQALVPGDIVFLETGMAFCDMVVVSTKTLLTDESALTGEANYVGKAALEVTQSIAHEELDPKSLHKRHVVFAGTNILETDESRAIVVKTSSFTARGEMIRDIYSYNRHQFKFDVEVPMVLAMLFFYAVFAFVITNVFIGDQLVYGFFYGMFVVGTILPPLLPTVFTVSVGVSDERLSRKRIACTNSESILVAGKVTRAFFDKTGTLTKQGLDFVGVNSASNWKHGSGNTMSPEMATGMAVCHTLTVSTKTGELVGNPVDRVMFQASEAKMSAGQNEVIDRRGNNLTIIKQLDFDHHRMTQSTIVIVNGTRILYTKGSGENIQALCTPKSTPADFDQCLRDSAVQGIYQISMAYKTLAEDANLSTISRDDLESDLEFLGVINFKNTLREETPEVISHLREGEVESIMITGDSILTGIKIARESGIIKPKAKVLVGSYANGGVEWKNEAHEEVSLPQVDTLASSGIQLAVSGEALSVLLSSSDSIGDDKTMVHGLMDVIRVYGRCTPYDKVAVVSEFVQRGFITAMIGDGNNDTGALKTAHVGIALSDTEASIVAPFTSLDKTITSVVDVLLEGRCALASALACYKFIILYGQLETILQIIAAYFSITFTEWCWVVMDVASAIGILAIHFLFQVFSLVYLFGQDWFACRRWENTDVSNVIVIGDNYETQVLFLVGGFQYITSAAVMNFGYEFRGNWLRNYWLVGLVVFYTVIHWTIIFVPSDLSCIWRVNCINDNIRTGVTEDLLPIQNPWNTTVMPEPFRRGILGLMIANTVAIVVWEYFVVNGIRRRYAAQKRRSRLLLLPSKAGVEESLEPTASHKLDLA